MNFFKTLTKSSQQLGNMEFGRRVAIEKDIERNEANFYNNLSKYNRQNENSSFFELVPLSSYNEILLVVPHLGRPTD